jgi:hypothetical protein
MQQDNGVVTKEATAKAAKTEPRQPASPLDGRLARWPLHPYLLCYFSVASFLAPNLELVRPLQVLPLFLGLVLACLALHTALYRVSGRRAAFASLLTFSLAFIFFSEPFLRRLLLSVPGSGWRLPLGFLSMSACKFLSLLLCAAIPVLGGAWGWHLSSRHSGRTLTLCLNLLMLGLFLSSSSAMVLESWKLRASREPSALYDPQDAKRITPDQYPDIVHVILDAYARDDVYARLTADTGESMSDMLSQWHFQVADRSTANFPFTFGSMFCLMNFTYPQGGAFPQGQAMGDCPLFRQLRHLGYRIEIDNWTGIGGARNDDFFRELFCDQFWLRTLWGTAQVVLYRCGILSIQHKGDFYRRQFESCMKRVAALDPQTAQPTYLQVHCMGPHGPYVYDAEGNHIYVKDLDSEATTPAARKRDAALGRAPASAARQYYAGQAKYCRRRLEEALGQLLGQDRKRPYVIIVQSDHGPRTFSVCPAESVRRELLHPGEFFPVYADGTNQWTGAFANYLAVLASPPLSFTVPATTTPVNLFPLLFNQVFGLSIPLRADRHFTLLANHGIRDCTDEVRQALRPVADEP